MAAGQEIFVWYGDAKWFEFKDVSYTDVDYANTMWRPDLHPLPCRQRVARIPDGADGPYSFAVLEAVPSGTVLEVSLCVEVSVIVVDQFPFLWDFVLTGETENEQTGCQQTSAPHAHTPPVYYADQGEGNIGEGAEQVLCVHFSTHSFPISSNPYCNHRKSSQRYDLGLVLGSFIATEHRCEDLRRMGSKHGYMYPTNQYGPEA